MLNSLFCVDVDIFHASANVLAVSCKLSSSMLLDSGLVLTSMKHVITYSKLIVSFL